ncbi:MAG: glycoside hydrolase [Micromonosporaceae bacterium]|nr:glycoside hydrolase [Micromonosporaceae bacterium]
MRIEHAQSEALFVGPESAPAQVARVRLAGDPGQVAATLRFPDGRAAAEEATAALPGDGPVVVEVPFRTSEPPGTTLAARAVVTTADGQRAELPFDVTVAETGWTMWMVSHFHYDPVWWNTQASYTCTWDVRDEPGPAHRLFHNPGHSGFSLVRTHLELARRDPEYRFVLAEVDYLKPYWDAYPADRAILRELFRAGRVEIMGGTYNEPNTNLTSAECTARNFVHGTGFQRGVLGADPATAWQLDAFGHDPQFAGMAADAGITSSAWARGPFHQWGPMSTKWGDRTAGEATAMQFPSEFMWLSPSGRGVLTHYMPNHYGAGWSMDSAPSLDDACEQTYQLFRGLSPVALTRNVLLPVGTDYTPPNRWLMDIHRAWRDRYVWPRFVCGLPREFFSAVREEMTSRGVTAPPQTRDMNPVYTGKDVSYVDTKQANRAAEQLLAEAETWACLARLLTGRPYDGQAFDKAWRLLVYGAHHDAITGSESDQVYVDLLANWREAHDLARAARDGATRAIADAAEVSEPSLVVFNSLNVDRADLVTVPYEGLAPAGRDYVVADGELTFLAPEAPGIGYATVPLAPRPATGWRSDDGLTISNERYRLRVDPARGGGVASLVELPSGRELIAPGRVGNELLVYEEYPQHPDFGEGPWHLVPKGPPAGAAEGRASVRREVSPIGERLLVDGEVAGVAYTQVLTLWHGVDRVDCATTIHEYADADRLLRVRWPCPVPGGLPVSEVGNAVIGRGFGLIDVDSEQHPWTLDNPAHNWFGLGATARIRVSDTDGQLIGDRAVGVAELVFADWGAAGALGGDLARALARRGVTATCAVADGPRYGDLGVDSNLPDVRIAVGAHGFTTAALAGNGHAAELTRQLEATGRARLLAPARKPLTEVWQPSADLTEPDLLPVLVLAGADPDALAAEVTALVDDLADGVIEVSQSSGPVLTEPLEDRTVALFNRGLPGFAVDASGALHLSLLRSCTGWPSGIWIDPPKRTAPDGSAFQLMHWSHTFEYAFTSGPGDWRSAGLVARAAGYNRPLHATCSPSRDLGQFGLPERPESSKIGEGGRRLLEVGSDGRAGSRGRVLVTAVKAAGNPLARGESAPADPADGITVRCYETTGAPARVRVAGPASLRPAGPALSLADPHVTDLLERPVSAAELVDGAAECDVDGAGIVTLTARPVGAAPADGSPAGASVEPAQPATEPAPPAREPAQPVFTRYWLHNKGPAPIGNQPVSVFLSPERLVTSGEPVDVSVTVSSELVDSPVETRVTLIPPDGWSVDPPARDVRLAPEGFSVFSATLRPAPDSPPGTRFLVARIEHGGQTYEDVATVRTPGAEPAGLEVTVGNGESGAGELSVAPGERTSLLVRLANRTLGEIRGELQAVSPYGTWDAVRPAAQGFAVAAGQTEELTIEVTPPSAAPAGASWLLAKVVWHGRVAYSPAIGLRVRRS